MRVLKTLHRLLFLSLTVTALLTLFWCLPQWEIIDGCVKKRLLEVNRQDLLLQFSVDSAERDASQCYNKHLFTITAQDWGQLSTDKICIGTHASLDHLHWLVKMTSSWKGPVSAVIFTPDIEYHLTKQYILYLRVCFPAIYRQVTFHFVYPINKPPRLTPSEGGNQTTVDCSQNYEQYLTDLLSQRPAEMMDSWRRKMEYPQNILRNIARNTCPSQYIMCPDIDMFPTSENLASQLKSFLEEPEQKSCEKCAYVIPVYEIHNTVLTLPSNKTELMKLTRSGKARPFHSAVFKFNQGLSKLDVWGRQPEASMLKVSYTVEKFDFLYEPIFVATRENPQFDERFVGFGNTRNSHIYEMYLAGWTFKLLNNAFLVHWGFQYLKQRPPWRATQANVNTHRLKLFLREMALKYDKDPLKMLSRYPLFNTTFELRRKEPKKSIQVSKIATEKLAM